MNALAAIAAGAGVGLGILLVVQGLRGRQVLTDAHRTSAVDAAAVLPWVAGAVVGSLAVLSVTGWPVAAVATLAVVGSVGTRQYRAEEKQNTVAPTEAIASWTEMIRDNMAGAAGLEQALMAASQVAPDAIRPEVRRFARRLDDQPLADALVLLGEELQHPSADLVVAALSNAARMETRDLGGLLGRCADSIRADVRMRLRVEVGRARIRTSARIVMAVTMLTAVFIFAFSRELLAGLRLARQSGMARRRVRCVRPRCMATRPIQSHRHTRPLQRTSGAEPRRTMSGSLAMMVVAAGIGFGVWMVGRALRPRPIPLATTLRSILVEPEVFAECSG